MGVTCWPARIPVKVRTMDMAVGNIDSAKELDLPSAPQ
jgi:hypothetical protein